MRDKIMILDTNDLNRSTLGNILCSDYVIIETKNAAESFTRLKESENELAAVLIDMLTSEEDGYQLLRAMLKIRGTKTSPFLSSAILLP